MQDKVFTGVFTQYGSRVSRVVLKNADDADNADNEN